MNIEITLHIEELLERKGWSRNELCRQSGISKSSLSGLFHGRASRIDLLCKIAKALNCGLDDLITFK